MSTSAAGRIKTNDPRSLHICFVCNELPPAPAGGIGPNVLTNAEHLVSAGHRVTVIGNYERNFDWNFPSIRVVPLLLRYSKLSIYGRVRRLIKERIQLRQAILRLHKEDPVDIVEWPDYQGLFIRPIRGVVDVVKNHGPKMSHRLCGLTSRSRHVEWLELHTLRAIPNWIGISQWFMNEWLHISGAAPRNKTVIYNTVDCDLFRPSSSGTRDDLILYCGSLWERKGVYALARASKLFLKALPHARLMFVGRDVDHARARIVDIAGHVARRIEFHDPMPQMQLASLMRSATVFAMPSLLESFGNVWAEAMASGVPVVGSKLSCGPEIVPDEKAGLLVDPGNAQEISAAIIRLMQNSSLRRKLGQQGRILACQRYSAAVLIPKMTEFYVRCVENCSQPK